MRISREVGLTEVYLDHQARLYEPLFPPVPGRVWAEEIAKAVVWLIGLVLLMIAMVVLAPEARGDSISAKVSSYLDAGTVLPLAPGVDISLATNLVNAQDLAWGKHWEKGSLVASEDAVLRAIGLYVWPGGPGSITFGAEPVVWEQSNIAIDPSLSLSFGPTAINFGEVPVGQSVSTEVIVSTPEPETWAMLLAGIVGLWLGYWGTRRTLAERMRARLAAYRVRP